MLAGGHMGASLVAGNVLILDVGVGYTGVYVL